MAKKCLSYWLVILIALQSFATIAGAGQPHQSDDEHLSYSQEHSAGAMTSFTDESTVSSDHAELDCHHCGHCHGSHLSFLTTNSTDLSSACLSMALKGFDKTALNGLMFTLFRPPKI